MCGAEPGAHSTAFPPGIGAVRSPNDDTTLLLTEARRVCLFAHSRRLEIGQ